MSCSPPRKYPLGRLEVCALDGWTSDGVCIDAIVVAEEMIEVKAEALLSVEATVLMVVSWFVVAARAIGTISPELQAAPFQAL